MLILIRIWMCFVVLGGLVSAAEAQPRRRHRHTSRVISRVIRSNLRGERGIGYQNYRPVDRAYLSEVLAEYREMIRFAALWDRHLANCGVYEPIFRRAAAITGYPADLIAGIALFESHCNHRARDWARGRGIMQLTGNQNDFASVVARGLGRRRVRWRRDPLDHVLTGVAHLILAERRYHDRGYAILGYNLSPRGIRRAVRSWQRRSQDTRAPTITELAPLLVCRGGPQGRCPRRYVARVLAAALFHARRTPSERAVPLAAGFPLRLVPGALPRFDE